MDKGRRLAWLTEEDEQEWPISQVEPEANDLGQITPAHSSSEWHLAALVALFCVVLVGGWLWYRWPTHHQAEGEVAIQVHQKPPPLKPEQLRWLGPRITGVANQIEQLQVASELADLHMAIQDAGGDGQTTVYLRVIDSHDDVALVEVITRNVRWGGEEPTHRQTRAFRRTAQGWQHTAPADDVWGPWQTWETRHFLIRYRPIDAIAVAEAAPQLDLLYDKLRVDFGLPVTATVPTITIEVVTEEMPERYVLRSSVNTIQVPSPASLLVPVETTAATILYRSVVYPLTGLVLIPAVAKLPDRDPVVFPRWNSLTSALRFWALWEAIDAPAPGRDEIMRWLYQNAQSTPRGVRLDLPAGYNGLCRSYPSWEVSPFALDVLLSCKERLLEWHEPSMLARIDAEYYSARGGQAGEVDALLATLSL
jgi:hypothetical protein